MSLRVHVVASDDGGCGHYRMIWPALAVRHARPSDMDVTLIRHTDPRRNIKGVLQDIDGGPGRGGWTRLHDIRPEAIPDCDVLVLQRPLQGVVAQAIPILQKAGITVVVEVDDLFHHIHPQNPAWLGSHPSQSKERNYHWLQQACDQADRVIVTTERLRRQYGRNTPCDVIPNYVPAAYLDVEPAVKRDRAIGWSGSTMTHPTDFKDVRGVIQQEVRAGSEFMVIGTGVGVGKRLGLPVRRYEHIGDDGTAEERQTQDPELVTGWVPIDQYPDWMAEIGLGVVPLDDIEFNHAKSWLKGLEFASLGVPFIASATDPYVELYEDYGIGRVARKPKEWRKLLAQYRDPDFRVEEGERMRDLVAQHQLTYEAQWRRWYDAWMDAATTGVRRVAV